MRHHVIPALAAEIITQSENGGKAMRKEKLMSIHAALGIVEKLSEGEEMKKLVGLGRHNLEGTAEQAEELEKNLVLPAEKMLEVV